MPRRTRFREDQLGRRVSPYRIGGRNYSLDQVHTTKSGAKSRAKFLRVVAGWNARVLKRKNPRGPRKGKAEWRVVIVKPRRRRR